MPMEENVTANARPANPTPGRTALPGARARHCRVTTRTRQAGTRTCFADTWTRGIRRCTADTWTGTRDDTWT